jgi:hypothetical protein
VSWRASVNAIREAKLTGRGNPCHPSPVTYHQFLAFYFRGSHFAAFIHAVSGYVVRTLQLTRSFILGDSIVGFEREVRLTHAAARWGGFPLRNSHDKYPSLVSFRRLLLQKQALCNGKNEKAGTIAADFGR